MSEHDGVTGICGNCLKEAELEKVGGYMACEECAIQASLPLYMRR